MTDKQIASYAIISVIVFMIALASGGDSAYADGFTQFLYYGGCIGLYTFIIWGWVRLFKSNK